MLPEIVLALPLPPVTLCGRRVCFNPRTLLLLIGWGMSLLLCSLHLTGSPLLLSKHLLSPFPCCDLLFLHRRVVQLSPALTLWLGAMWCLIA